MTLRDDIFLCEQVRSGRRLRLFAVLDELTLTYTVTLRVDGERSRPLRSHLPSLQQARDCAAAALRAVEA